MAAASDRDLTSLLLSARRTNAHYGVTGRLLVLEYEAVDRYLQWLEGTGPALDAAMARSSPTRRTPTSSTGRGSIPQRRYPDWDMAFGVTRDGPSFDAAVAAFGRD